MRESFAFAVQKTPQKLRGFFNSSPRRLPEMAARRKLDQRRDDLCAGGLRKGALRRRRFISAKRVHRPDDRAHETQSKIWSQNVQPRFQTSAAE
jgi:hypothetical protein